MIHAPWKIHLIRDRWMRVSLYMAWGIIAMSVLSFFVSVPWWLFTGVMLCWAPVVVVVMVGQFRETRQLKKDSLDMEFARVSTESDEEFIAALPPHLQEDFKMFLARMRLGPPQ